MGREHALKPAESTAPPAKEQRADQAKILIVDDRRENLIATEKVLKRLPAELFMAESGNEALSLMLRHKFAAVILDVQMPEMDGFEAASLMQEDESMRGTPIIFVTAISKEEKYATRAAEIGAVDYIFKPINPDILRSKVEVYLDLYIQREQILKLNENLRQSNVELERFAYLCAHDLKTPLRAIHNLSQWLEEDLDDVMDDGSREYMTQLRQSVWRMEKLLDDTLEYARCGTKISPENSERITARQLAEDVVSLTAPPKGFTIKIGDGLSDFLIYRLPLQQVLHNLASNAIKHHNGTQGTIELDAADKGDHYEFTVRDDGPGIAPQFHDRIFEMFQTIKADDKAEGSGMGLAIVKKVVTTYGGNLFLESDSGRGTTFRFTWPKP